MRRAIFLAALFLAASLPVQAAEPNEVAAGIAQDIPIQVLALAETDDRAIIGTLDPGGNGVDPGAGGLQDPESPVWFLWQKPGLGATWAKETFGRSDNDDDDPTDFYTCGLPLVQECHGHIVAVDMSAGEISIQAGTRFVTASTNGQPDNPLDSADHSIIQFLSSRRFVEERVELPGEVVTDIDLTPDGKRLAVGSRVIDNFGGEDTGRVRLFEWAVATPIVDEETDAPVTDVALSGDGNRIMVGAGNHLRVTSAGVVTEETLTEGDVVDVAAARTGEFKWSVAGFSAGHVNLYSTDSEIGTMSAVAVARPSSASQNAVAIHPDGSLYAAGDAAGDLRLFVNVFAIQAPKQLLETIGPLDGPVRDMAWSADGRYLVVGAGKEVAFYRVSTDGLDLYWSDVHEDDVVDVAIDATGDRVLAAAGVTAHMYEADHALSAVGTDNLLKLPLESTKSRLITYTNDGNREAVSKLTVEAPAGWTATLDPATFSLKPGQEQDVYLNITPKADAAAGPITIALKHDVGGQKGQVLLPYEVIQKQFWAMEVESSLNQAIDAGGAVTYNVTLTNEGNAPDSTTIVVNARQSGWGASVSKPTVTDLAAGDEYAFQVVVTAPADAQELDVGQIDVGVDTGDDAIVTLQATVGARFGVSAELSGPGIGLYPGNTTQLMLSITNTGNTVDSYLIESRSLPNRWDVFFPDGAVPHLAIGVAPGETRDILVTLEVDDGADPANYQVGFTATSQGDTSQAATKAVLLSVVEVPADPPAKKSPGAGALLVPALAALAYALRRRQE